MAKISTYPSADVPLQLSDRLIGTEAIRPVPSPTPLATKNFSLGELLQLFSANFPAASLQAVLNTGNTATQNINLTGTIDVTLIKPDNIEDTSGSQGTTFQFLSKGTSSINWVDLPVDNLQAVLNAGNTATQSITLIGNITSTKIIPGNIQDDTTGIGTAGQFLSKTASGIRWVNAPTSTTPGLADVLSVGNTATNNINLIGNYYGDNFYTNTGGFGLMDDGTLLGQIFQFVNSFSSYLYTSSSSLNTWELPNQSGTIALTSDIPAQGLTSVGLSMPVAFNISNNPLTSDGTIAVSAVGTASQYIRGDGQLATFPSGGGGGSSVNYYLNGSIAASVATYKQMSNTAIIGTGTDFALTGNGLIAQFLTDVGNPNRTEIPGGAWNFEMFFSMSTGGGNPKFYVELLKYDGAVFTSIASSSLVPETISGGTIIDLYLTSLAVPTTPLLVTDRLAVRVYIVDNTGSKTATLHTENSHLCEIITTFSGGVTSLNGLTANTQYFAVGTLGTDFDINSTLDTHTFNIPNAGIGISRGLITNITQSIDGSKTFIRDLRVNTLTIGKGGGNIAENTAVGFQALFSNTTGIDNTASGNSSLLSNTTGSGNTANGVSALRSNTTGSNNTANGVQALFNNTTSSDNTANGVQALFNNTTGVNNTANGRNALYSNTTGSGNTANGISALYSNTTGSGNIAIGNSSDTLLPNDSNSIAIGSSAIGAGSNTVVLGNTSIVSTRLRGAVLGGSFVKDGGTSSQILMADGSIVTASSNISITGGLISANFPDASVTVRGVVSINDQSFSGLKNFTDNIIVNGININKGSNNGTNIAIGAEALDNTIGNQNTVIGFQAASNNDVVSLATSFNTVLGYQAYSNGQANNNTAIGWQSLFSSAANNNSALGYSSGLLITTGFQNTFIGAFAGGFAGQKIDAANSTAIGYQAITTKNNQIVLGNSSVTETVIRGTTLVDGGVFNAVDSLIVGGPTKSTQYKLTALNTAPASATAAGTLGEIRVTAAFIYVCIATNTWVRAALTTW